MSKCQILKMENLQTIKELIFLELGYDAQL